MRRHLAASQSTEKINRDSRDSCKCRFFKLDKSIDKNIKLR